MKFQKFGEWFLAREADMQNPMSAVPKGTSPAVKPKIDPRTNALLKKKIAAATADGKFDLKKYAADLERDQSISPEAMKIALGGGS